MNIELVVQSIKSHPDSTNPKRREYTAIVKAVDLWKADEISTEANPRDQVVTNNAVVKGIKESLLSNDGNFRYKNQGITINCESVLMNNKDPNHPIKVTFSEDIDDLHGILNGGHTYRTIRNTANEIEQLGGDVLSDLSNQEVLVRFFTGETNRDAIVDIAEGQNSSVSVTKETIIHMRNGFKDIISKLPNKEWEFAIQFRQNEYRDDDKTPCAMDSRDLLAYIYSSNSDIFPSDSVDRLLTRGYSSKSSLVNMFDSDEGNIKFNVTKEKLKNILFLRDYLLCTAEKVYNENGGRFGSLRIAEKFNKNNVVNLHEPAPKNTLNRGAFLPILSSFRIFEEKNLYDFKIMKKAWDESGYEIIEKINEIVSIRDSITEVGKDAISWSVLANQWNFWLGKNS